MSSAARPDPAPDPFRIAGPAVISFSGGRTSAYMLWRCLQAHGGTLPNDVLVCFANTGREMPATLDFVRDCGAAWNVPIVWLEYTWKPGGPGVQVVNHNSAAREGEPFEAAMRAKRYTPNPVTRFCTTELKIRTVKRWVVRELGWSRWTNIIGLRADEPGRVARNRMPKPERWTQAMPLADAGVDQAEVFRFWKAQSFDLMLAGPWEGNCDGCFLKARAAISRMFKDHPERMAWWPGIEQHRLGGVIGAGRKPEMALFRADREDYATMARIVRDQGTLPFDVHERVIPCDDAGCGI